MRRRPARATRREPKKGHRYVQVLAGVDRDSGGRDAIALSRRGSRLLRTARSPARAPSATAARREACTWHTRPVPRSLDPEDVARWRPHDAKSDAKPGNALGTRNVPAGTSGKPKAPLSGAFLTRPERFELPTFGSVDRVELCGRLRVFGVCPANRRFGVSVQSSGPWAGIPCWCSESCRYGPRGGGGDL